MKTKQEMMDDFNENERMKKEIQDKKDRFYSDDMKPFKNDYLTYLRDMTGNIAEEHMINGVKMMKEGKLLEVQCFDDWYNSLS